MQGVGSEGDHGVANAEESVGVINLAFADGGVDGHLPLGREGLVGPEVDDTHEEAAPVDVVVGRGVAGVHQVEGAETTEEPRETVTRFILKDHLVDLAEQALLVGQPSRGSRMRLEGGCGCTEGQTARHWETPE